MNTQLNQTQETPQQFAGRFSNPDDIREYIDQNEEGIQGQKELLNSFEKTKLAFEDIQTSIDILTDSQTFQPVPCLMESYGYSALQFKVLARQMDQVEKQIANLEESNLALEARLEELNADA